MQIWRCDITGNPVGTDTRMIGAPDCDCQGCRADREIKRIGRIATDRSYMMEAYRAMLGPVALQVVKQWDDKGVLRQHTSWGPDARQLSGEERAQALLDAESAVKIPGSPA